MSNSNSIISQIESKLAAMQQSINSNNDNTPDLQTQMDELKALLQSYENSDPNDASIVDDLNFALNKQSLTIEEREELLNTKIKQIDIATQRNAQTKNMLTVFIIINVIVLLVFVSLIVMKATGK
jgi:hypothetical protein